ncbi:MAG: glycosyltransferase family 2 protein [Gemmataceae bacterium]
MTADLSVIIPTYNRAGFLPACVASVRACGVPAEIVIVDDGSTDDTPQRVRELGDVSYIRQPNAGVSVARNAGVASARGELLAFLDSDDTWRPGVAPKLVTVLRRYADIDVAFADALAGNSDDGFDESMMEELGGDVFRRLPDCRPEFGVRLLEPKPFFRRLIERNQMFLGSAIMRRRAFEAVGGFDPALSGAADYDITLRLAHRFGFAYLEEPQALYLRHPGNMSANRDKMDREFALVMAGLLRNCPDLSPADRALVRQRRRLLMYYLGYNSYDRGDYAEARRRLRELFREFGPDPAGAAVWAASHLPAGLVGRLRRFKRLFSRAAPT